MRFQHTPIQAGTVFGRLTVVGLAAPRPTDPHYRYACRCSCGAERIVSATSLRNDRTTSCGCVRDEILGRRSRSHGQYGTPLYRIWNGMMGRCHNPNNKDYGRYGGRGIRVCDQWHSFANFAADMPPRPSPAHSIGRADNDKGYEPGNVRWETPIEQQNNLRSNRRITHEGETLTVKQWSRRIGINVQTIHERIKRGWPTERVLGPLDMKHVPKRKWTQ